MLRDPLGGDVHGPSRGDFTDWDNPEDELEEAPDEEELELTPDDPDYDLSEAAGYRGWEDRGRRPLIPAWVVVAVSLLLVLALVLPALLRFG